MKNRYILISIPIMFLFIGIIFYFNNGDTVNTVNNTDQSRPNYNGINSSVFEELPPYPKDFVLIKRNFYDNQIHDLTKIRKDVYMQPEFYPTWETNGIKWYTEHDYSRWGVHGYGAFPSEVSYSITNMSRNDEMQIYTFFHTSWGIETWQGLKFNSNYNTTLFSVDISPNMILLEPTFPKIYQNWTYMMKMNIRANQKIPAGVYVFSLYISQPSDNQSELWSWYVLDEYTNNKYHSEIEECKKQLIDKCDRLVEMRQNKYISGGQYAPSNLFTANINIE